MQSVRQTAFNEKSITYKRNLHNVSTFKLILSSFLPNYQVKHDFACFRPFFARRQQLQTTFNSQVIDLIYKYF